VVSGTSSTVIAPPPVASVLPQVALISDDQSFRGLEYLNHFEIALGSQGEVGVQLEIAFRLGYCERAEYERIQARVSRVGRMLNGLIASVKQRAGESQS